MPSLINQMRQGGTITPMQTQQTNRQQLDNSIANTRKIMQQYQMMTNKQQAIASLLQNNPQLAQIASMGMRNGNLQQVAQQMAQQYGVDINYVINSLLGK